MKPAILLLVASLIANVAFVALLASRPPSSTRPAAPAASPTNTRQSGASAKSDALRAALASGDVAALEAAGFSPETARELALGRTFSRMAEKIRATQTRNSSDARWWRSRSSGTAVGSREQQLVARRELTDALMAAFGEDFGLGGSDGAQFSFLPAGKRDALRRIIQDYDEMFAKFGAGGIQLPSDREKLRLLRQERDRDIAALLTPEEHTAYEMRTSMSANMVRSRYGDAIESEAEFQKIYTLQKAFDEKFPREGLTGRISSDVMRTRAEAERQLEAAIRSSVGEERYAALRRAADPDVRMLDSLASRLELAATTTDSVLAARNQYAAESQRITNDSSLPAPQRRVQIQDLANQAKTELVRALGSEGAEAYAQSSPWMNMLQNGMAYSTTPQDGTPGSIFPGAAQSVFPVMPPGTLPAGAQRQFVINATPPVDVPVSAGTFIGGGNMQVMTFSTSASTDLAPTPSPGTQRRQVIVAPGQAAPAPAPTNPSTPAPRP